MDQTVLDNKIDKAVKHAPLYMVIIHNDDVNTFEWVIACILKIFHTEYEEAVQLTHQVHNEGKAVCRVEPFEPAELHRDQLRSLHLSATMEAE